MRSPRPYLKVRAVLAAVAVLGTAGAIGAAVSASAQSGALTCQGLSQSGRWQRIHVDDFPAADSTNAVTSYALNSEAPNDLAATNGDSVQLSTDNGCDWKKALTLSAAPSTTQPFAGSASTIVGLARFGAGTALAAVQEGTGAASSPHVLRSANGTAGSFTSADNGLPAQGAPGLLRPATDGSTVYLTIRPTGGGSGGGTLPPLPVGGGATTPAGLLYASTDGGESWSLRTAPGDLPGGGSTFTALAVDTRSAQTLYALSGGELLVSTDGGASFTSIPDSAGNGFTALTPMAAGSALASDGDGHATVVAGSRAARSLTVPTGITSLAARNGDASVIAESSGTLRLVNTLNGAVTPVPAGISAKAGSALGDLVEGGSFHAVAGHSLLRYVDPAIAGATPVQVQGDPSVVPPRPGTVLPAARQVTLPVGATALEPFTLDLPKNPTPLDLFFLVDDSGSQKDFIDDLKTNILQITTSLQQSGIDLKAGVATLGTGPGNNEQAYPETGAQQGPYCARNAADCLAYRKPVLYKLLGPIDDPSKIKAAVAKIAIESTPHDPSGAAIKNQREGQLAALEQAVNGDGIRGVGGYEIAPDQAAQFRSNGGVRHLVVLATDEEFDDPAGSPEKQQGAAPSHANLDFTATVRVLNSKAVKVFGIADGDAESRADLETVARGTGTLAPARGADCGGIPDEPLAPRAALVCSSTMNYSQVIQQVVASLADRQDVQLSVPARSKVLGALDGSALKNLDVTVPNSKPFTVAVSCVGVKPGAYVQKVQTTLRGTVVGRASVTVNCVKANAATLVRPVNPPGAAQAGNPPPPPAQPVPGAVPPIAPPAPVVQPQAQPQTQVQTQAQAQLQPLSAGALQEQQELQLALALADHGPGEGLSTMGMVDRRRRQEVQALGLLAFAVASCAGLGLAGLRAPRAGTAQDVARQRARR